VPQRSGKSRAGRAALVGCLLRFVRRVRCCAAVEFVAEFTGPWPMTEETRHRIPEPGLTYHRQSLDELEQALQLAASTA